MLEVGQKVVTAVTTYCEPVTCSIVRGIVGEVKGVHRDGTVTVTLNYRGKTFRWTTTPDIWMLLEEWKKHYPEDYKKWRQHMRKGD